MFFNSKSLLPISFIFSLQFIIAQELSQEEKEKDTINYRCYTATQITTIGDKSDTAILRICKKRLHTIFKLNKKYTYSASLIDTNNVVLSTSNVYLIGTNEIRQDDKQQTYINIIFDRQKDDSSKLQTYLDNKTCCSWINSYKTGVIEGEDYVYIHPIQYNQFIQTEIVGFPQVYLPLDIKKSWNNSTSIYAWGDWKGKEIKSKYKVLSKKEYSMKNEKLDCWKVECISNFDGKTNKLIFLFNELHGFVQMNYEFSNGNKIIFEMKDYIYDSK